MDVITANSLDDGAVVFRTASGSWSRRIEDAEILDGKEPSATALAAAEADAAVNIVVEPYAVAVTVEPAGLVPLRLREKIRAAGPTVGNSLRAEARKKVA